jgi:DMSO/TMAO reductase YedYZ molybdopterin-dependent catalytic subunit
MPVDARDTGKTGPEKHEYSPIVKNERAHPDDTAYVEVMAGSATSARIGAGLAASAVAVGIAECLASVFPVTADSRNAVGSTVIDLTPGPVKEWAIQTFGTSDKLFLSVTILAVIGLLSAVAAIWERSRVPVGSLTILAGAAAGCGAVLARDGAQPIDIIPAAAGAVCGIAVLRFLTSRRLADRRTGEAPEFDPGRRRSLATVGFIAVGALTGVIGNVVGRQRRSVSNDRNVFALPTVTNLQPPIPADVQPAGVALPRFITSNADFYRIDTALTVPQLSRADWRLRIHGMVDHEVTYSFADLEKFDAVETTVTLTCVSNPVGGELISTAIWTGYRIRDLLAPSQIHPDADMILSKSIDGFTAGTPVEAMTDDRDAILAIGMNGEPLPVEHGYPARLVVPGLYGFVSATKWVVDIELTRFDRASAYWTELGWSARAPIKTQSRIDVPRAGATLDAGPVTFGGVAWAQHRGIKAVELRIDDGEWQQAQLGAAYSNDTWRLWRLPWDATPGSHTIEVRATDNTGATQTQTRANPVPDGATGWHTVSFEVR